MGKEFCEDEAGTVIRECPDCFDKYINWTEGLHRVATEKLATAIRWLRRLEKQYPGCINADAIEKHLES